MNAHLYLIFFFLYIFAIFGNVAAPKTTKNAVMVYFDGYEYRKKGISTDKSTQFWSCTKKTCNGRTHSPIGSELLHIVSAHNHARVEKSHEARIAKESMKMRSRENPEIAPRNLIAEINEGISDEARVLMPSYGGSARAIERQREIPGRRDVDAGTLANILIQVIKSYCELFFIHLIFIRAHL